MTDEIYSKKLADMQTQIKELVPDLLKENEERKMSDICTDKRFEVIERYKQKLIKDTNIEQSPKEMEVLDSLLFRFWQMGWLERKEK